MPNKKANGNGSRLARWAMLTLVPLGGSDAGDILVWAGVMFALFVGTQLVAEVFIPWWRKRLHLPPQ